MLIPKYKLSGRPFFTFNLPARYSPLWPLSGTPLAMIYCIYIQ